MGQIDSQGKESGEYLVKRTGRVACDKHNGGFVGTGENLNIFGNAEESREVAVGIMNVA